MQGCDPFDERYESQAVVYAQWQLVRTEAYDKDHRPLQKRERTGKKYGCFPFV